ncbi:DUF2059 domain-containing protein [Flavobacterium sp. NST-5]|uniref:DUF2059 domain-containing protein n=1 Tax=Flavobacterium ichthyis TaxID=2698827 RepID=A0ABW9Z9B8_9FLAO|nr:DUF2059 domain-containing protein [Flavobacterium ichthyis]NBL65481.1 DUF2059 domain-containing protein [Flavobacterium ichthyis]
MKKVILTFALIVVSQLSFAQDAFKADIKKYLELSGSNSQIEVAKKQVLSMIPEDKQAAFTKDFEASLPSYFDKVTNLYMTEFTHDDIKNLIKFYESPIGKKLSSKAGVLTEKSMEIGQVWGGELQGIIMKYLQ